MKIKIYVRIYIGEINEPRQAWRNADETFNFSTALYYLFKKTALMKFTRSRMEIIYWSWIILKTVTTIRGETFDEFRKLQLKFRSVAWILPDASKFYEQTSS